MKTINSIINSIISESKSFETSQVNGFTDYVAEGDLINTLEAKDFIHHNYKNHQTGRKEFGNMWALVEDDDNGLFIFTNGTRWYASLLMNGEIIPF